MNRKIWAAIGGAALVAATALPALAADNDAVTATVTPTLVAVSITDGVVDYGTLGAGTSKDTLSPADTQVVSNDGNINEDFVIKGQNSTPDGWTLAATAASEAYKHEFTTTGTFGTALTTTNQSLSAGVASSGTVNLDLKITTPTSTTATNQQNVDVVVQASAS